MEFIKMGLPGGVLSFVLVAYSIILHEIAHGYSAKIFGDQTAARQNRLSLNPVEHIDPMGTLVLPIVQLAASGQVFLGWAKPVPVNPYNLEPRVAGEVVVALAGIFVNLCIAVAMAILLGFPSIVPHHSQLRAAIQLTLIANVGLAIFNLVPIPPLDGHHVVKHLLPPDLRRSYEGIGFQGVIILLVLNMTGLLDPVIGPPIFWIVNQLFLRITFPIMGA